VDAGLSFGDGAVIDLDFDGLAKDQEALGSFAAGGDEEALGDGVFSGADGDGDFCGGESVVGDVDGDEPVAGLLWCGEDAGDGEVGQSLVGVDPVGEEPGEVAAGSGLLQEFLKGAGAGIAAVAEAEVGGGIIGAEGGGECGVASDGAEHPEDIGGFGSVVDGGDGLGEWLAHALAGTLWLGEGESGTGGFKGFESLVATALFLDPEGAHEVGDAFREPGAGGFHPGVGDGVSEDAIELVWIGRTNGCYQQGAGFVGGILGVGQVKEGELGAGPLTEPSLEERGDGGGGVGPGGDGGFVIRQDPERGVGGGQRLADGNEEAGALKAEGLAAVVGGGDAGDFLVEVLGDGDGERGGMAVDEGYGGRRPWGNSTVRRRRKCAPARRSLWVADFVEEAGAVAEDDGDAGDGIPDDVAEAAQAGEGGGGSGPSRSGGLRRRGFRWYEEALGVGGDGAGVGDVKLEGGAGGERLGEGDGGFMELAGVVGVGVEDGDGEG
jgi:hypothetical protein